jgi:hypothetical protein
MLRVGYLLKLIESRDRNVFCVITLIVFVGEDKEE